MVRRGRGRPPHPDVLTPAEWTVLNLWRHGLSMTAVARRHGLSRYAVRYHLRNAAGKIGVGSTARLRDWPGVPVTSARYTTEEKVADKIQLGPLGQVSMLCRSAERTEEWFRDVLGLPHVFTFGDLVFFDCGGVRLFLRQVPDEEWRPSSILYFLVADIAAAHRMLLERGVTFTGAPHMIHCDEATGSEEWMAFFEDPDENVLAITSRVRQPPK
jgi:DNA-binding CsgD family transcriptional regulator/catechol 2,3-dioxygenase-like lactoylglutathione lyase family enzyme